MTICIRNLVHEVISSHDVASFDLTAIGRWLSCWTYRLSWIVNSGGSGSQCQKVFAPMAKKSPEEASVSFVSDAILAQPSKTRMAEMTHPACATSEGRVLLEQMGKAASAAADLET